MDTYDQTHLVYAAEDAVSDEIGRKLLTWNDVLELVTTVLQSDYLYETFPNLPPEIHVEQRETERASLAFPLHDTICIAHGAWNVLTVLHEITHLVGSFTREHGASFVGVELEIVRHVCGIQAATTLRSSFIEHGVEITDIPDIPGLGNLS